MCEKTKLSVSSTFCLPKTMLIFSDCHKKSAESNKVIASCRKIVRKVHLLGFAFDNDLSSVRSKSEHTSNKISFTNAEFSFIVMSGIEDARFRRIPCSLSFDIAAFRFFNSSL